MLGESQCARYQTHTLYFLCCNTSLKVKKYQVLNFVIAPFRIINTPFFIQSVLQNYFVLLYNSYRNLVFNITTEENIVDARCKILKFHDVLHQTKADIKLHSA